MKMMYNIRNKPIQEFQHSLESKLIEVVKKKIFPIQLVSNVNLIQIQSIQVVHLVFQSHVGQVADASSE
jgi:hypothetical protein